jgi:single-strand DNA-binding protein
MSYQKVIVVGNLGSDPSMRYVADGTPVTSFSVATSRKWDGGEETTWFRVTAWKRTAEIAAQYLAKGRQVMVEGTLTIDRETGGPKVYQRNDGTYGASFEMRCDRLVLLGGRGDGGEQAEPFADGNESDIPF